MPRLDRVMFIVHRFPYLAIPADLRILVLPSANAPQNNLRFRAVATLLAGSPGPRGIWSRFLGGFLGALIIGSRYGCFLR